MTTDILQSLTPAQREAVTHVEGPLLILAGPGSGKTRVVTHRVAYLMQQGVPAQQVLALTFTNKAADEMLARVDRLVPDKKVWMGTFHRFCARLLRQYAAHVGLGENYTIYDSADSLRAFKDTLERIDCDLTYTRPEEVIRRISTLKNNLVTSDAFEPRRGNPVDAIVAKAYPAYQARLRDANAADFDDLLLHVAQLLRDNDELRRTLDERFKFVLVDEYQDTNLAQYAIVRALSIDYPNLAVTGDPDQSIYGWRGANLDNILDFEKDYPNVKAVRLEQNYRSTQRILHVADRLIANNILRKEKQLFTENDEGQPVRLVSYWTHEEEAQEVAATIARQVRQGHRHYRDVAVFYRTNALSRAFEHALAAEAIPFQIVNSVEFFQRKEVKDVLAYLQLVNNPADDMAFLRAVNTPTRGIGKTTLQRVSRHAVRYALPLLKSTREHALIGDLTRRAGAALAKFADMIDRLAKAATGPVEEIVGLVLSESGYRDRLEKSDAPEDQTRLENVEELLTAARDFDGRDVAHTGLEGFLEQAALVNDTDELGEKTDRVSLMTLHAAKGLEFPMVFIVAVEDGLLPHERSRHERRSLEEERRLLFVGITRAEEQLQLSYVRNRAFRGQHNVATPSMFLMELPRAEMDVVQTYDRFSQAAQANDDAWDDGQWDDDEWKEDEEAWEEDAQDEPAGRGKPPELTTAASLLGPSTDASSERTEPATPVETFRLGMAVLHPQYGPGKIAALSGAGLKRTATVNFPAVGQKKFRLAQSPLRPVGWKG